MEKPIDRQTEKQKYSKSPLYGYRKPEQEEKGGVYWCKCEIPNLGTNMGIGGGQAYCYRCHCNWYH